MVIVSGFLGSGKTSTILALMNFLRERNVKVAVIVNDFGQIGIDAKVMTKYGLQVKELAGGCICCTLGVSLMETVQKIALTFKPDLIIMEPTGIADPRGIVDNMSRYHGPPISEIRVLHIIDAPRFDAVLKAMGRLFLIHTKAADVIMINKIDEVPEEQIEKIERHLRQSGFEGRIIGGSAERGDGIREAAEEMFRS